MALPAPVIGLPTCGAVDTPGPLSLPRRAGGGCPDAQQIFDSHNMYRSWHQAEPLEWDKDLAREAQQYAEQLARGGCLLKHSGDAFKEYGENIYGNGGYPKPDDTCKVAADVWYGVSRHGGQDVQGSA